MADQLGVLRANYAKKEAGRERFDAGWWPKLAKALSLTEPKLHKEVERIITERPLGFRFAHIGPARAREFPATAHRAAPGRGVPIINKTSAGTPVELDDPGVENHEHLPITPEMVGDPDAFGVELVGDSMAPQFCEGDIVVFAPRADVRDGDACFVQFNGARNGGHTFKLVFRQGDGKIELRPMNQRKHRSHTVDTSDDGEVARIVKAVGCYRRIAWEPKPRQ